jgi:co-chaperonin GroES (HSP10)
MQTAIHDPRLTDDQVILLTATEREVSVDWQTASQVIRPLEGIVVVERHPAPERRGVLYLPEEVQQSIRSDVATVIASGVADVQPGDVVLVRNGDGKEIEGFHCGPYRAKEPVYMYGIATADGSESERVPWWESVVAVKERK